jgi:quercetin dioxygenase-like cupin family protein
MSPSAPWLRAAALLLALASVPMFSADSSTPKPLLGSAVFEWSKLTPRPTPNGERRDVADNPTATFATFESHISTLNPGQASHLPHRHPQEELIIVKEGLLDVSIGGQVTPRLGPGSMFFFAANDAHAVRNAGDTRATYFVINLATEATRKSPLPTPAFDGPPTLRSSVFDWEKLVAQPTKVGARRGVVDAPTITLTNFECHVTTINPGEAPHAAHRHPDEEIIVLREGTLEVTINGQTQRAGPGSILFYGSNDLHGMRNVGDVPATYHVIRVVTAATPKAPSPAAK